MRSTTKTGTLDAPCTYAGAQLLHCKAVVPSRIEAAEFILLQFDTSQACTWAMTLPWSIGVH